ncbi:MAG: hypothetical protein K2W92_04795 [Alphaproteobacteria bacterium]|nr:hypothetical protein [Alphaproteobacteria bacterium]
MFRLIAPKKCHEQESRIGSFFNRVKNPHIPEFFLKNHTNATFILTQNECKGIYGGAVLLKQSFSSLHKSIQKSLVSFTSATSEMWTCTIFLHLEDDHLSVNFESLCKSFYQNLYKTLADFGLKENIGFLCLTLLPGEYLCTEAIGFWPYVVEVRPQDSLDGLFHGIVSLAKDRVRSDEKKMGIYSFQETQLAA